MSGELERERAAREEEVRLAQAAQAAMKNPAIVAYFDAIEAKTIDAMLALPHTADLDRFRLSVVVTTIRRMKAFLNAAVTDGEFSKRMLEQIAKEDRVNGA